MRRTKVTIFAVGGREYISYIDTVARTAREEDELMDAACAAAEVAGVDVSSVVFEEVDC